MSDVGVVSIVVVHVGLSVHTPDVFGCQSWLTCRHKYPHYSDFLNWSVCVWL